MGGRPSPIYGDLKCWVEEWDMRTGSAIETLAQCLTVSIGRAAFEAAVASRPNGCITLREWSRVVEKSPAYIDAESRARNEKPLR